MIGVAVVTFLAGLLFGYDQGVISGALPLLQDELGLTTLESEVVTAWVTLGALFGALIAGTIADRIGRRYTAILAGALFVAGALLEAAAPDALVLTIGRVVTGLGVGFASVVAPLYAAEVAPKAIRGAFVSTYQLAITFGILLAYLADDLLTPSEAWRLMFGLAVIPGVLMAIGFWLVPESVRWLLKMGRRDDARASLTRLEGPEAVDAGMSVIEQELEVEAREGEATWAEVFSVRLRKPIMIGIGLAILQQVTGINAIIYYANSIFEAAGFTTAEAQAKATLYAIGLVNFLATFIAIAWIDRFGRRPLLFAGLTGMGVSLFLVAVSFAFFTEAPEGATSVTPGSILTLVALVAFIASFAFSMGPVVWTIISEIYPNRVRGRAIAVATAFNWLAAVPCPSSSSRSWTPSARPPRSCSSPSCAWSRSSSCSASCPRHEAARWRRSSRSGNPLADAGAAALGARDRVRGRARRQDAAGGHGPGRSLSAGPGDDRRGPGLRRDEPPLGRHRWPAGRGAAHAGRGHRRRHPLSRLRHLDAAQRC
jgi:sugar porter (SP) family MFS transporter